MSKQQEFKTLFTTRTERVKMIDMHPKEPLILCSIYTGQVMLWNYETKMLVKTFEIIDQPVRCVKFVPRLQSFVCGADDLLLRVFNYNTMEKTKSYQAHDDYLRAIAVHDQLPVVLTCSDDMTIKQWDWSKGWAHVMTYEGHTHYIMAITFNPKEPSTFATASLDNTVKVWSLTSPSYNFQLEGHDEGVNCVEYYPGGDKPYIVSGSDDRTVRVWDYQTKACIQTLSFHMHNVTCVFFHPDVPLLFTGSEDETVGVVSTQTWRVDQRLNVGLQRVWTIMGRPATNTVAIGFDKGFVAIKVGKDAPVVTMDANGKIYYSVGNDVCRMDIKSTSGEADSVDGEPLILPSKELGTCESTPTQLLHGPAGQYVTIRYDAEYTINSALAWRSKAFGQAIGFAWGHESGTYAILESPSMLKSFRSFKAKDSRRLGEPADAIFGGALLGVRTASHVAFYDWETLRLVRRVGEVPTSIKWSDSDELVALVTQKEFFLLKYHKVDVQQVLRSSQDDGAEINGAFDLIQSVHERLRDVTWAGDCMCYVTTTDKLQYYIGGETTSIAVVPKGATLLGYIARDNRIYCIDKDRVVVSYTLHTSVVEYKSAIVREDFVRADELEELLPVSHRLQVARFLQGRGLLENALRVTSDDDHRFELAVKLRRLDVAVEVVAAKPSATKWQQIGDLALREGDFQTAERAMTETMDDANLLLLYSSLRNIPRIRELAATSLSHGNTHISFTCHHLLGDHSACVDLLLNTGKPADASFYARTYCHARDRKSVV